MRSHNQLMCVWAWCMQSVSSTSAGDGDTLPLDGRYRHWNSTILGVDMSSIPAPVDAWPEQGVVDVSWFTVSIISSQSIITSSTWVGDAEVLATPATTWSSMSLAKRGVNALHKYWILLWAASASACWDHFVCCLISSLTMISIKMVNIHMLLTVFLPPVEWILTMHELAPVLVMKLRVMDWSG